MILGMPPLPIIFLIVVFVALVVPSANALESNGVIEMPFTENTPAIDGKWTTPDEWKDASETQITGTGHQLALLLKHDREFVYVMGDIITDYAESRESEYAMALHFDTNNDGGVVRKNDDFRLVFGQVSATGNLEEICKQCVRDVKLSSGWNTDTNRCEKGTEEGSSESGANYANKNWIWNSVEPIPGKSFSCEEPPVPLGLALYPTGSKTNLIDYGTSDGVFKEIGAPARFEYKVGFSSENDPYEPGRDHRVYEFKIPIDFLHRSDSYGFGIIYWVKTASQPEVLSWPNNLDWKVPSTYGSLTAQQNAITAPPIPMISVSEKSINFGNVAVSEKSGSKTVAIKNLGTSTLKIKNIRSSADFSVTAKTPVDVPPGQQATFEAYFAPITLGEKSGTVTISSNDLSNPIYTISLAGAGVEKGQIGGGCLIATAAYETELAPRVQLLRELRDNTILDTHSGMSFMAVFNSVYYAFSPTVADWERQSPIFKETVKMAITPMLSTLTILNYAEIDSEQEMLGYGIGIILLNVGMYFVIPAIVILKIRSRLR